MKPNDPRLAVIANNVELALTKLGPLYGEGFGFDDVCIDWVDGFIERMRKQENVRRDPGALLSVIGSYLGQAIIVATGGHWAEDEQGALVVEFDNGDTCSPFSNVAKHFELGHEGGEGVAAFYDFSVNFVATGKAQAMARRVN